MEFFLSIVQVGAPMLQFSLRDLFTLGGALVIAGALWQQVRTNSKDILAMRADFNKMEERNLAVIEKIGDRLEELGERFYLLGEGLKGILADHAVRLALLEKDEVTDD